MWAVSTTYSVLSAGSSPGNSPTTLSERAALSSTATVARSRPGRSKRGSGAPLSASVWIAA